jgi:hypothetical protein
VKPLCTLILVAFSVILFWDHSTAANTQIPPDTLVLYFIPGWSIFSTHVLPDSVDMKFILQTLIDNGKLVKIQDENGKSLEDYGILGGWINHIGIISLAQGYKIKVTEPCQLIIKEQIIIQTNEKNTVSLQFIHFVIGALGSDTK